MKELKRNIWLLYAVTLALSLFFFIAYNIAQYHNTLDKYQDKQLLQLELFATSVDSLLKSQDSLLEVTGRRFIEQQTTVLDATTPTTSALLDKLTEIHPGNSGFGLTNIEGDFLVVDSKVDISKLPNLKQQTQSRESFLATLQSEHLVIGRTYYFAGVDSYVLPVRKAIRDQQGNPIAVMTAGMKLDSNLIFQNELHSSPANTIYLLGPERYYHFVSAQTVPNNIYSTPVAQAQVDHIITSLQHEHGIDITALKQRNKAVTITVTSLPTPSVLTLRYLSSHKLWAISSTKLDFIQANFWRSCLFNLLIFSLIQMAFFALVRAVANHEQKTRTMLYHQATHDPLTDLPNHWYLRDNIQHWMSSSEHTFGLLYLDIDNFKNVNDTHGHDFGDKLLKRVAERLKQHVKTEHQLLRESSDEFILLVRDARLDALSELAQALLEQMSRPFSVNTIQFHLSCSIGIAVYPEHGRDLNTLLRSADISMYHAKKERNTYNIFTQAMQAERLYLMRVEQRLRLAIEQHAIFIAYQPQFGQQGQIYGIEALARWKDPELGIIGPDVFIPLAERSGLMLKLGQLIIERSLADFTAISQHNSSLQLSLNISVKQFMHEHFVQDLQRLAQRAGVNMNRLTLEITENLFVEDLEKFKPICHTLHKLGAKISLDDFGTGYSSLSMLRALPIDELKIDKSFIEHIEQDTQIYHMVGNIIEIGKGFGMSIVAEGIETIEQAHTLTRCGSDYLQGYYFAKPIEPQQVIALLEKNQPSLVEMAE